MCRYTPICQLFDEEHKGDQIKDVLEKMVLDTLELSADLLIGQVTHLMNCNGVCRTAQLHWVRQIYTSNPNFILGTKLFRPWS